MGEIITEGPWAGFEVVSTYTRRQAIEDGVLIDLSNSFPKDTTVFKWNVCCTSSVWALIENAADADNVDAATFVYDLCFMAGLAIKTLRDTDRPELFFKIMLPLCNNGVERKLKLVCGPVGPDDPSPCLTIMMPDED